jgi:hypothetical protein
MSLEFAPGLATNGNGGFDAPAGERTIVDVSDVRGALVARLYDGLGGGTVSWNGITSRGERVSSGVCSRGAAGLAHRGSTDPESPGGAPAVPRGR